MTASRRDMIRAAHKRHEARAARVERTVARVEERHGEAPDVGALVELVEIFAPTVALRRVV